MLVERKNVELNFYYKPQLFFIDYFLGENLSLRFDIANIIKDLKLPIKKYYNRIDQKELLLLKEKLTSVFDNKLLQYSQKGISKEILSIISEKISEKEVLNFIRENKTNNKKLFYDVNSIDSEIKVLKFILEKNLSIKRKKSKKKIKKNDLNCLIKFGEKLYYLQIFLDFLYYGIELGYIEIDSDYNLLFKFNKLNYHYEYLENKYDASYKVLSDDLILEYENCFKLDMGFDIKDFIEVSSCLSIDIPEKYFLNVYKNVFEIKKDKLIKLILKYNHNNLSFDKINTILNYLIINKNDIKVNYRRENTFNRIDQKPIIEDNGTIYYSPAFVSEVHRYFLYAILVNDFPYKVDLPNINNLLDKVKKLCEKQIINDSLDILKKHIDGPIFVEKKLHQINSKIDKTFSESVGDYDILAIDTKLKIIYNIEIKNLKLFTNVYEMYRQYYGFYHKNKYEEKFGKRIDSLKEHIKLFFPNYLNFDKSYKLVNIFLTNKQFIPLLSKRKDILYLSYPMLDDFLKFIEIKYI